MLESWINAWYIPTQNGYASWVQKNKWAEHWVAFWLCIFCILVTFPSYEVFIQTNEIVSNNWAALQAQADFPLKPLHYPPEDHAGQIAFRLLLPGLAHVSHLPIPYLFFAQHIAGWVFLYLLFSFGRALSLSSWNRFLIALGFASTYVVQSFFVDVIGYFDAFCFLILLTALIVRPLFWQISLYFLCFFIDERAFLSVPFVAVARYFYYDGSKVWKEAFACAIPIGLALLLRTWLHSSFGLENGIQNENLGLTTARINFQVAGIGLLTGLKFGTFLGFLPAFAFWKQEKRILGLGYGLAYVASLMVMLAVLDLTRCTAYLFPAVLAGISILAKQERPEFVSKALLFFMGTALLFPSVFVVGTTIVWMGPILPKLFRLVALLGFGAHI